MSVTSTDGIPAADVLLDLHELRRATEFNGRRVSADVGGIDSKSGQFVSPSAAQNALERLLLRDEREVGVQLLSLMGSKGCSSAGQAVVLIGLIEMAWYQAVPALHRLASTAVDGEAESAASGVGAFVDFRRLARQLSVHAVLSFVGCDSTAQRDALMLAGMRVVADIARYCEDESSEDGLRAAGQQRVPSETIGVLCCECDGALSMREMEAFVHECMKLNHLS